MFLFLTWLATADDAPANWAPEDTRTFADEVREWRARGWRGFWGRVVLGRR